MLMPKYIILDTTTTTTTTAATTTCESSQLGDSYCHDACNTAEFNFDDGDCCAPTLVDDWDSFCTECACIECVNRNSDSWCESRAGNCAITGTQNKCPLTCGSCTSD